MVVSLLKKNSVSLEGNLFHNYDVTWKDFAAGTLFENFSPYWKGGIDHFHLFYLYLKGGGHTGF